jgi:membrane-bound metal-dependent hydrolase YbcI (DUF457 family)
MDTITHGVAGALIAKALPDSPQQKLARRAVILGSILPDLDLLAGLFTTDDVFQLEFHRGITHSLVALPVFAALLAYLTVRKHPGWLAVAAGYSIGLASHIFLDVITAYGTMIFQPLSRDRYTLDMVFIIDLTLGSLLLLPQLVAWAWRDTALAAKRAMIMWLFTVAGTAAAYFLVNAAGVRISPTTAFTAIGIFAVALALPGLTSAARWPTARYCRLGLVLAAGYLIACGVAHHIALEKVRTLAAKYQLKAINVAALPAPPSLLRWNGLIQDDSGVARLHIVLTDPSDPVVERYINSDAPPALAKLQSLPKLQTYLWFARFPWMTTRETSDGTVVEYRDIQFLRPAPRGDPPFTFRVKLDRAGNLVASGLSVR